MDVESVRSGRSARSDHRPHRDMITNGDDGGFSDRGGEMRSRHHRGHSGERRHHGRDRSGRYVGSGRETDRETDYDDRSERASRHSRPHGGSRNNGGRRGEIDLGEDQGPERIDVQIIPQDDNWGETATAVSGYTGATSETGFDHGFSQEDMSRLNKDLEESIGFNCARYVGSIVTAIVAVVAFLSPVVMVVLPKLNINGWNVSGCGPECEGLFISFTFKLIILVIGSWALFFRKPKATMPRIFIFRALILFLVFLLTFAFWLFYGVRILDNKSDFQTKSKSDTEEEKLEYYHIVLFSGSFVDALLFIHYLAVILLEIRQMQLQYVVRVVRSPDGISQCYSVGALSIQRLAVWVLEQYYKDFPVYNPYLENIPRRQMKIQSSQFKVYNVDGVSGPGGNEDQRSGAIFAAQARRRDSGHNDRFYEQEEYERRVRKRRARLIVAAEEAFTHIKRIQEEAGPAIPMDPQEAAQSIFPSLARALQKYLRITRQQPRYTMENIIEHLALCIGHDLSPKSFLERYLSQGVVIWNDKDYRPTQTWVVVCEQLLSRAAEHGTVFQLRQGDVSLMVQVRKLPHFNLTEDVIDPKTNKFVLRLNSETSV